MNSILLQEKCYSQAIMAHGFDSKSQGCVHCRTEPGPCEGNGGNDGEQIND